MSDKIRFQMLLCVFLSELTSLDHYTTSTSNSCDSGNVCESRLGSYRSRQHAHGTGVIFIS